MPHAPEIWPKKDVVGLVHRLRGFSKRRETMCNGVVCGKAIGNGKIGIICVICGYADLRVPVPKVQSAH
jgi:hypothetical protein